MIPEVESVDSEAERLRIEGVVETILKNKEEVKPPQSSL